MNQAIKMRVFEKVSSWLSRSDKMTSDYPRLPGHSAQSHAKSEPKTLVVALPRERNQKPTWCEYNDNIPDPLVTTQVPGILKWGLCPHPHHLSKQPKTATWCKPNIPLGIVLKKSIHVWKRLEFVLSNLSGILQARRHGSNNVPTRAREQWEDAWQANWVGTAQMQYTVWLQLSGITIHQFYNCLVPVEIWHWATSDQCCVFIIPHSTPKEHANSFLVISWTTDRVFK